ERGKQTCKNWGGKGTKAQQKPPLRRRNFNDEVTRSSTRSGSSNSPPRGQEKGGMGKGQGKAARAALRQLIEQQKQHEADHTNQVRQRREGRGSVRR
ncbi:unnamed protein product, partial [Symbiodinium pilosum]